MYWDVIFDTQVVGIETSISIESRTMMPYRTNMYLVVGCLIAIHHSTFRRRPPLLPLPSHFARLARDVVHPPKQASSHGSM